MRNGQTVMGGQDGRFHTTCWTQIGLFDQLDEIQRRTLLEHLISRYWKPVYCYLRRKGYDNERSKDLTQGFFGEVVLGRQLLAQAHPRKGKFRTLLLTALDRYVIDLHRWEHAQKRSPPQDLIAWDCQTLGDLPETTAHHDPQQAFVHAWAANLLDEALALLENECKKEGFGQHWQVFRQRVLDPIMKDTDPPGLEGLCQQLGINNPTQASNMIVTVKRRFREVLKRCLSQHVETEEQIQEELHDLIQLLSGDSARSN